MSVPFSFVLIRKKKNTSLQKTNKLSIFAPHWFAPPHTREAIKRESGVNPEQSRCCKFHACYKQFTHCHWRILWEGARNRNKSEDLPCNQFHCFRGKSVESNEPDNSVYHFIHHSDSEKVCFNKLCQKFIYACSVEGISPGHF